ncbi:hypothetical protein [Azospirillum sp.]|uniref:hypothetical protein n=1 Tax=Azospirillum sp. TaxID=34012 RepID=UPI003D704638
MAQVQTVADLRGGAQQRPAQPPARRPANSVQPVAPEAAMPTITVGFGDLASWEFTQRVARGLASSTLVPAQYQLRIRDKKTDEWYDNPSAIPNCIIAINMANRIGADVLMVMQNLYIVEGRPSWSSQFVISAINSCKRFTSLQFKVTTDGTKDVEYSITEWTWDDAKKKNVKKSVPVKTTVPNMVCVAWATEKATGERLESPPVSMEMAVKEGWYGKNGSKWQTMPELMIRYRAATFFGRLYAPELLMGLKTVEENQDIIEAELNDEGVWAPVEEAPSADGDRARGLVDGDERDDQVEEDAGPADAGAAPPTSSQQAPADTAAPRQDSAPAAADQTVEAPKNAPRRAAAPETAAAPEKAPPAGQLNLAQADDGFGDAE